MTANIGPYREQIEFANRALTIALANGRESATFIAISRRALEIMESELARRPDIVVQFDRMPPDPKTGLRGPNLWQLRCEQAAGKELVPEVVDTVTYGRKVEEYLNLGELLIRRVDVRTRYVVDRQRGRGYLYQENPQVIEIMKYVATHLIDWFQRQEATPPFIRKSAQEGLSQMLTERPAVAALLRLAQTLPKDVETFQVRIERPAAVEAVKLALSFVPVVGNAVAAFEAYSGTDLFGFQLDELERGILAACVLLPVAGRFVKAGRALYTEARLVRLYGGEARNWSKVLATSGQATKDGKAFSRLSKADIVLRSSQHLERSLATEAASALKTLTQGGGVSTAVDPKIRSLFEQLSGRFKIFDKLDLFALERVLNKGPNVDHLKGQLLEELVESRIVPWLQGRTGAAALGVSAPGKQLEFIPGYLVRDAAGRQITDGMVGFRANGVFEIVAVFEAKAGRSSARELSITKSRSLTEDELLELRAFAKDVWRDERELARLSGKPPPKRTIAEIEAEIIKSEHGGQIRRDIERLVENADGTLTKLQVGGELVPVRMRPSKTKFFGVIPKDVSPSAITAQLQAEKVQFEILGIDASQRELKEMAAPMVELARELAAAP